MATPTLDTAQALYQAKNYSGSGNWLDENNSHDATITGATFHTGAQYVYLPGVNGNYFATADAAPLDIADNLDIQVRVALDDWTPSTSNCLVGKYEPSGNQRAYIFWVEATTGLLRFLTSDNGTSTEQVVSSVAPTVSDGAELWVRVTHEAGSVKFYTGGTGASPSWTQLGTTQTLATNTTIFNSNEPTRFGAYGLAGVNFIMKGEYYNAIIRSAIDGTIEFDADLTDTSVVTEPFTSFTEASSNAATVDFQFSGTGAVTRVIDRPQFFLTTDDYFEVADDANLDFGAADSFTVMLWLRRPAGSPAAAQALVAKRTGLAGTNTGWSIISNTDGTAIGEIADGTNESSDASAALVTRTAATIAMVRNVTDDDIEMFKDGTGSGSPTTDATTATLANAEVMRFGRLSGAGTSYARMQLFAVAIWRSALSDAQVSAAHTEMTTTAAAAGQAHNENFRRLARGGMLLRSGVDM